MKWSYKRLALLVGFLVLAAAAYVALRRPDMLYGSVQQPVAFNHKKHMDTDLTCLNCHTTANKDAYAGMPTVRRCIRCHESEEIDKPETEALKAYTDRDEDIPWVKIYRVSQHTFFSHRRHVSIAELDCAVCHGEVREATLPVTAQAVRISMDNCVDCHSKKGVTNDCLACHR